MENPVRIASKNCDAYLRARLLGASRHIRPEPIVIIVKLELCITIFLSSFICPQLITRRQYVPAFPLRRGELHLIATVLLIATDTEYIYMSKMDQSSN